MAKKAIEELVGFASEVKVSAKVKFGTSLTGNPILKVYSNRQARIREI